MGEPSVIIGNSFFALTCRVRLPRFLAQWNFANAGHDLDHANQQYQLMAVTAGEIVHDRQQVLVPIYEQVKKNLSSPARIGATVKRIAESETLDCCIDFRSSLAKWRLSLSYFFGLNRSPDHFFEHPNQRDNRAELCQLKKFCLSSE